MNISKENFQKLISKEEIQERIVQLGREINEHYNGEPVVAVCVLKGAFMFFADLVRQLDMDPEIDFLRLASYGSGTESSGKVLFTKDMEVPVEGKHVLIIEDIVDSGRSMDYLLRVLNQRGPKSVKVCTLLDKSERREVEVPVDFYGFRLSKGFVVGYGLDYAEKYRELPDVYEVLV